MKALLLLTLLMRAGLIAQDTSHQNNNKPILTMNNDPKQIPPPGFVAEKLWCGECAAYTDHYAFECTKHQSSPSPLPQDASAPDPQGQDRGQGEGELSDCIDDAWGVIANAIGWGGEHPEWKTAAERWRDKWLPIRYAKPAPQQSAVEWVEENKVNGMYRQCDGLPIYKALELAKRCEEAETKCKAAVRNSDANLERIDLRAQLAAEQDYARQSREEIEALKGDIARLTHESTAHQSAVEPYQGTPELEQWLKAQLAAAQAEAAEMRKQRDQLGAQVITLTAEIKRLRKGITEIKAGTRIGWFMTDLGAKCEKLLNP